jgi:alkylation response protein AidB-like acyl-CoA dehydrogenase
LHVLLKREGYVINHKKLFRLYREEKLAVRRRGGRKRAIGTRAPMMVPMAPNDRWSLDFVSDQLTDGRRFRILTVVDDCTRECLALVADTSLSGTRMARELDRLVIERGKGAPRHQHLPRGQRHARFREGARHPRDVTSMGRRGGSEAENVVVPAENLLGGEGAGFSIAQHQFNRFRLRLGGVALGMSERSQELAVEWAKTREVFGGKLGDNQAIQWMLTDSQYDIESIRLNTYYAAWLVDRGGYSAARLQASMVKGYCIDAGLRVVDRSMQILGGRGLAIDDYPFSDFYNQLRMCKQMEGSTEIMKIVMAREILGK